MAEGARTIEPPVAERRPLVRDHHGVRRVDDYAWLREIDDPRVRAHLRAERDFYDESTRHLRPLVGTLAEEMSSRVPATDRSVSWNRVLFSYYTKTPAGSDYAQLCRGFYTIPGATATKSAEASEIPTESVAASGGADTPDQVLLDPAKLAGGSAYVELGVCEVSPDERLLAYSVDTTGDEVYALRIRDLDTGEDLPEEVSRSYYGTAWSADSRTLFYTVHDEKYRGHQVWRHRVGTAVASDVLVLDEPDERFELTVRGCRSGDVVLLCSQSRESSEVWLVDAHRPEDPARCVQPRRPGVEYAVEHARTADGDRLFVLTNDGATEFRLMVTPLDSAGRDSWVEAIAESSDHRLLSVDAFAGHLVVTLRHRGLPALRVVPLDGGAPLEVEASGPAATLRLDRNERFDTTAVTVAEESYTEPVSWWEVDLVSGERRLLRRREVPAYDSAGYVSERRTVSASDGTSVPVTLVRRRDVALDGSAPCLMYGYGAYEACDDPAFEPALISLLDRGVVYAHAHVRGGGEGGRRWWLQGRMASKQNTFSDHLAVADALADGVVDGARMATRGLSAGGLLQGAVFSQRPDRWRAVVAEVPFVDVVTTMLDPSIPLTVNEWEEWGDPRKADEFAWLRAYSPYDNLPAAGGRPDLLVTGSLHDPRVMVWEPAKWVAALRAGDPDWSPRCLFRCELGVGAHVGPSGRYTHLRYEAEIYAWVLDRMGAVGSRY
ncbi:MAG: S9 family peptidase [Nocardioidaceae bacterium]